MATTYGPFKVHKGGRRNRKRNWWNRNYKVSLKANPANIAATAAKGLALARYVASMVNAEKKYTDAQVSSATNSILDMSTTTPGTTDAFGNLWLLNQVTEGTDYFERTGNSVKFKHIQIRYQLESTTGGLGAFPVRVMVFQWKDNTVPTFPDVFQSDASGSYTVPDVMDYYQKDNAGRKLIVHYDKLFTLVPVQTNDRFVKIDYINLHMNMHTRYDDAVGLPSDNRLYFLVLPANATDNDCFIKFSRRCDYVDN